MNLVGYYNYILMNHVHMLSTQRYAHSTLEGEFLLLLNSCTTSCALPLYPLWQQLQCGKNSKHELNKLEYLITLSDGHLRNLAFLYLHAQTCINVLLYWSYLKENKAGYTAKQSRTVWQEPWCKNSSLFKKSLLPFYRPTWH